jgi:hypothetical protein
VRSLSRFLVLVAILIVMEGRSFAQPGPKLHEIDGFMVKGIFTELDPERVKHRLSLQEIEKVHLDGKSTDINHVLDFMAQQEKIRARVEEPLEVRGQIPVVLPPNTMGGEAYTTCFYAFTFNGLVLSGNGKELILVRPETRPRLVRPKRPWNRNEILSTQLFRLGYLKSDPILRQYRDQLGTKVGHAVLELKSNMVIVTDTAQALEKLRAHIDSEILEAMGVAATAGHEPGEGPRPPSLGAIASRENIHFYLAAFARWSEIPLAASEEKGVLTRHYPEADLWTNERGYRALESEYKRVNEYVRLARQTAGEGWNELEPQRTLSPAGQRKLAIQFGVVSPTPAKGNLSKNKKTARKR